MDMHTEQTAINPSRNFFVASVQKKVFSRSNIAGIFVNQQNFDTPAGLAGHAYNRTGGLQFNLASRDNTWTGQAFGLQVIYTRDAEGGSQFTQGIS
jgi:hypothetical protein